MSGISLEQFQKELEPVQAEYAKKMLEVGALQDQFCELANRIAYQTEGDASDEEHSDIQDALAAAAYEFNLEWDGSFEEGSNEFWESSSC